MQSSNSSVMTNTTRHFNVRNTFTLLVVACLLALATYSYTHYTHVDDSWSQRLVWIVVVASAAGVLALLVSRRYNLALGLVVCILLFSMSLLLPARGAVDTPVDYDRESNIVLKRILELTEDRDRVFIKEEVNPMLQRYPWLHADTCIPAHNIAFLKIHKCASSTVQNLLMRYGNSHDLTFAMPAKSHIFPLSEYFKANFVHSGATFHAAKTNIFTMHSIWNKTEVSEVLYGDAKYFTIVRDPADAFISLYDYFAFETFYKMPLEQFVSTHGIEMERFMDCLSYNIMACDMGARPGDYSDDVAIKILTERIDSEFDFVMVAERFEESLVLMSKLLCWPYEELVTLNVNARYKKKDLLTSSLATMLEDRLRPDYFIYKFFTDKFDRMVEEFGAERMKAELTKLRVITDRKLTQCNIVKSKPSGADGPEQAGLSKVDMLITNSTDPVCLGIIRPEQTFVNQLKVKQAKALQAIGTKH